MDEKKLRELVERLRLVGADQQRVEVKSGIGKAVLETLSAFSNGAGGTILVGLEERGGFLPVPGFDATAQRDALVSRCRQMTPTVRPDIVLVPFEGNVVVVATVPEMLPRDKPCHVTARGRYQGSYLRTGDGDVRLQYYEVDRLVEEHVQPAWDEEPVPGARPRRPLGHGGVSAGVLSPAHGHLRGVSRNHEGRDRNGGTAAGQCNTDGSDTRAG